MLSKPNTFPFGRYGAEQAYTEQINSAFYFKTSSIGFAACRNRTYVPMFIKATLIRNWLMELLTI